MSAMASFTSRIPLPSTAGCQLPAAVASRRWRRRPSSLTLHGILALLCVLVVAASRAFAAPQLGGLQRATQQKGAERSLRGRPADDVQPGQSHLHESPLTSQRASSDAASFSGATTSEFRRETTSVVRHAGSWLPSWPQTCEDDYECNDGKANFPLQCCEFGLGNFCCEPDDFRPAPADPALVTLPVPVEDPWQQR
mmetsp:Transcript_5763/g.11792  ORF Transcript_5763/g.11792 Transcript_5763/m.11792 type:complete len:196 (+) Transcript_5763:50-637(+)